MTMTKREEVAREQAVISLSVALTVMKLFERKLYARIGTKREIERGMDRIEAATITSMTTDLAKRFAPFAAYIDDTAHHWQALRPTVRLALVAVPMEMRVALAKNGQKVSSSIAQRIFDAVDKEFRLVPLEAQPKMHSHDPWPEIFQREHGHASLTGNGALPA